MELWYPPKDRPHLLEWWRPLMLVSRAARLDEFPWPIHLDEMVLVGRVDRSSRPAIWVYRHAEGRGEVYADSTGQTYKFTRTPNAKGYGRFSACELRTALWRAGLPDVVEPIFFRGEVVPAAAAAAWDGHPDGPADELERAPQAEDVDPDATQPSGPREPRQRGHLTVHDGGQPLAG